MLSRDSALVRSTNAAVTASAVLAGVVLFALMILTTVDVIGRYFFNAPLGGVVDLTEFSVLLMTFLSFAYCGYRGAHVVIELLYDRFGHRTQMVLRVVANLAGAALFGVMAWRLVVQSVDVREFAESSQLLTIPFWPFYIAIAFGAALFAWVMLLRVFADLPDEGEESKEKESGKDKDDGSSVSGDGL
jgi:TRAP-type C4-dicarboxylate transport system permease small subunit